jgi:hypothetical protein
VLHFRIGIEPNVPRGIIDSSYWKPKAPRAVLRFFQLATHQTTVQPMQFSFAHGASES